MPIFYFVFSILFLGYFVFRENHFTKQQRFIFKIINSANFCILALVSYYVNEDANQEVFNYIMLALVLGAIGDIFLGLQYVFPSHRFQYFILGFMAFLSGHLVYVIYFLKQQPLKLPVIILMILVIGFLLLLLKRLKITFEKYKALIYPYLIVITFIWASSLVSIFINNHINQVIFFIGITAFFGSDCLLSILYFNKPKRIRVLKMINSSLYFGGQLLIAFSIYLH